MSLWSRGSTRSLLSIPQVAQDLSNDFGFCDESKNAEMAPQSGHLPASALLLAPIMPLYWNGDEARNLSLFLQILFLPAFFLMSSILLFGYPYLIASNSAFGSLRYAVAKGKTKILKVMLLDLVLLVPIPEAIFHLLMPLSYPFLVSWAVSDTDDGPGPLLPFERQP